MVRALQRRLATRIAAAHTIDDDEEWACDEDAYRILRTPGQAVSGIDDQARRALGRAG
jgi:hypothetical protein